MKRSIPLNTYSGWLKQIDVAELNPLGHLALGYAFPMFLNFLDFGEDKAHEALTRKAYGRSPFVQLDRATVAHVYPLPECLGGQVLEKREVGVLFSPN